MKLFAMILLILGAMSAAKSAFATPMLLDGCEDAQYTYSASMGDSVAIRSCQERTQGNGALEISFQFIPGSSYSKTAKIEKTFPSPIDLSSMASLTFDYQVSASGPLGLTVYLIDEKGCRARYVYGIFGRPSAQWASAAQNLTAFRKSMYEAQGKAVNLRKIKSIQYRIYNHVAIKQPGKVVCRMDNVCTNNTDPRIREELLEGFESYSDTTALAAKWIPQKQESAAELDRTHPHTGAACLRLKADVIGKWISYSADYAFPSPRNFADAKYFKISIRGDSRFANSLPTAIIALTDQTGNRAEGFLSDWGWDGDWDVMFLPFDIGGIDYFTDEKWSYKYSGESCWRECKWDGRPWNEKTNLSTITKLSVTFQCSAEQPYPVKGMQFLLDNIIAGFASTDAAANTPAPAGGNPAADSQPSGPAQITWYRANAENLKFLALQNRPSFSISEAMESKNARTLR